MPKPLFSLSSTKGGEGRGEEAVISNPLAPALSPPGGARERFGWR
jgi:hypothetical protein